MQLSHQINIDQIIVVSDSLRIVPVRNQFDDHGELVSLNRIHGEKNWAYRRRIFDVFANRANSSYRGLINGITRELGLSLFDAMSVNPKLDSNGAPLSPDPYIKFDGVWLLLYSDYANDQLDWAIDRYQSGGNFEHIGKLVDQINETAFFEASIKPDIDPFTRSMTILNQSNREIVGFERIPSSTKFRLKNSLLVPGTVFFANRTIFRTEVDTELEVDGRGKYYINYPAGIVTVYTVPTVTDVVRYQYTVYPFSSKASPVILHDINRDNFKVKMFHQVLQEDGTFAHGIPTEIGVDIINELISVSPLYWGV